MTQRYDSLENQSDGENILTGIRPEDVTASI